MPGEFPRRGLPASGILYFFYNQEQETWGFDPKDKGSWQVLFAVSPREECSERHAPQGLSQDYVYPAKPLAFSSVETYPDWQDELIVSLHLSDKQSDEYIELCSSVFQDNPTHHLFGYPSPVQGKGMDLECQLVSNGLYCGDASGYNDPRVKELTDGRADTGFCSFNWTQMMMLE